MCSVTKVKCLWFNDPTALISIITRQADRVELGMSQLEFSVTAECQGISFPFAFPFLFPVQREQKK